MAARDPFAGQSTPVPITSSANYAAAVTPSDATTLDPIPRALWIGGAGNVAIVDAAGTTTTLQGVAAGTLLPLRARKVMATNTTATLIVAIW